VVWLGASDYRLLALYLLKSHVPGEHFFLDIPEVNSKAVALAERHKMSVLFQTVRMYSKEEPHISQNRIFGVTTFELG